MEYIAQITNETLSLFLASSIYVIFGLIVSGLIRVFLNPNTVIRHLGTGRFLSVLKAAFLGIPLPLCSCGVLPTAVGLKKQGANSGATTAFLISTPESGIDSIAITYALLDPIMTIARPVVAFISAIAAGFTENIFAKGNNNTILPVDLSCPVDNCCDGRDCPTEAHASHHTFFEKLLFGLKYAFTDVWSDMASWFIFGLVLAGIITAFVPDEILSSYLGGGISSMLIMLIFGIPLYICATASTPIAAALILKGVSPGAALVFLIAGPATNITSLTVLFGVLGKRATLIYLSVISASAILFGLLLDKIYFSLNISAVAVVGNAADIIPFYAKIMGMVILSILSIKPLISSLKNRWNTIAHLFSGKTSTMEETRISDASCHCASCDNAVNIQTKP